LSGIRTQMSLSMLIAISKNIADIEHDDSKKNKDLHVNDVITIGSVRIALRTTTISCKNFETIVRVSRTQMDLKMKKN
jgi:hypothetical protein